MYKFIIAIIFGKKLILSIGSKICFYKCKKKFWLKELHERLLDGNLEGKEVEKAKAGQVKFIDQNRDIYWIIQL